MREAYLKGLLRSRFALSLVCRLLQNVGGCRVGYFGGGVDYAFLLGRSAKLAQALVYPTAWASGARPTLDISRVARLVGPHWGHFDSPPTGGGPVLSPAKEVPWLKTRLSWSLSSGPKFKGGHRALVPSDK